MASEIDDDVPCLSAKTFAALHEFYREQEERELSAACNNLEENVFQEDWVKPQLFS